MTKHLYKASSAKCKWCGLTIAKLSAPFADCKMTDDMRKALRDFASRNGRTWKSKLHDIWMTGNYGSDDDSQSLQQIRNTFGPTWLVRFPTRILVSEVIQ